MKANRQLANMGGWQDRHDSAVANPKPDERPMVEMISAWAQYAIQHQRRFESTIGEDYVLGPNWQAIGEGLLGLLNGETGRLDCGTLDGFIRDTMKTNDIEVAE